MARRIFYRTALLIHSQHKDRGCKASGSILVSVFQLSGGGRILGVGNGNPSDHDPDRASERNAFHGHCIVLIQAGSKPESLELSASSPGLKSAAIHLRSK
jgi:beta-galactosidase